MDNNRFKKYRNKLIIEGLLKASVLGLIIGFGVSIIPAVIAIIANQYALLLSILTGVGAFLLSVPIIYFAFFKPTTVQIARRIDRLGLEERYITMLELENDQSYMAMRQREDTKQRFASFNKKLTFVFGLSAGVVFALVMLGVFMVSSITTIAVAQSSVEEKVEWKHPGQWEEQDDEKKYIRIRYIIDLSDGYAGGVLVGESEQLVAVGEAARPIVAAADIGYVFAEWSDGTATPQRTDFILPNEENLEDIIIKAKFVIQDLTGDGDREGEKDGPVGPPDPEGENEFTEAEDERYKYGNQYFDETVYYKDGHKEAMEEALKMLSEGGDIPAYLRELIETYYNILK